MAIFEQKYESKVTLDDTESLKCVIENWQIVNGHTEFIIRVNRGPFSSKTWRVSKRYNDFHKLHTYLQGSGVSLQLPPKRLFGNLDPQFIHERMQALQEYLNSILMNPILVSSLPAKSFVDPANYCQPFGEQALQHVQLALRSEVGWEVIGPLNEIGWRLRKHYYQIRRKASPKDEYLASWIDYGPDKYLDEKHLQPCFKSLIQMRHPFIEPIHLVICTDVGGFVIRQNHKQGTLRDILCGSKPKQSFLKKYANPKECKPLDLQQIASYAYQILLALKFLHEKGLPYGHLHSGNIIIENECIKLLDIENGMLGVPSFYRPYFMQHRKISTLQAVDVYCFGHTLYEMSFGTPLHESMVDTIPECAPHLKSILQSILSSDACKTGLPSIDTLLKHEFFTSFRSNFSYMQHAADNNTCLKFSTTQKDQLKAITKRIEDRLRDEQKTTRNQKRLVKVQEMMSSEEDRRRRGKLRAEQRQLSKDQSRQRSSDDAEQVIGDNKLESGNSSSTTTQGTSTPPSTYHTITEVPPPPPPPPLQQLVPITGPFDKPDGRSALLNAISKFDKDSLRKTTI